MKGLTIMKKTLLVVLALVLVAALSVGLTLAFLTDSDKEVNTFTVGKVDIELIESQYYPQVDTGKTLADVVTDSETYQSKYLAEKGDKIVPGEWVRKVPYVRNTGANDAYIRINVTLDADLDRHLILMENTTAINAGTIKHADQFGVTDANGNITYSYIYTAPVAAGAMTEVAPVWQFKIKD
ncbi:MAG: hypothetical protein IIY02_01250, partial [Firmicutes bacterium]|nr:hypothetical protein [Bacillota bacterium]